MYADFFFLNAKVSALRTGAVFAVGYTTLKIVVAFEGGTGPYVEGAGPFEVFAASLVLSILLPAAIFIKPPEECDQFAIMGGVFSGALATVIEAHSFVNWTRLGLLSIGASALTAGLISLVPVISNNRRHH
jgi:hypothetical protein